MGVCGGGGVRKEYVLELRKHLTRIFWKRTLELRKLLQFSWEAVGSNRSQRNVYMWVIM